VATLSQIEANRRNAQHSTGPRTAQGKAASSMNAFKSGIDAGSSVIPGEDPAALAALTERLYHDCQPQTEIESILVDNIIRAAWLLRRFDRIDAELLIYKIEDTNYPSPNGPVGKAFDYSASTQSRLQRRINDTNRLQREAIKDLQRIQAERPPPQTQPPARQPVEPQSLTHSIGFDPQTHVPQPSPEPPLIPGPRHLAPGPRPPALAIQSPETICDTLRFPTCASACQRSSRLAYLPAKGSRPRGQLSLQGPG
jgi:hypothetical protein